MRGGPLGKLDGDALRAHEGAVEVLDRRLRVRHCPVAHKAKLARLAVPASRAAWSEERTM